MCRVPALQRKCLCSSAVRRGCRAARVPCRYLCGHPRALLCHARLLGWLAVCALPPAVVSPTRRVSLLQSEFGYHFAPSHPCTRRSSRSPCAPWRITIDNEPCCQWSHVSRTQKAGSQTVRAESNARNLASIHRMLPVRCCQAA